MPPTHGEKEVPRFLGCRKGGGAAVGGTQRDEIWVILIGDPPPYSGAGLAPDNGTDGARGNDAVALPSPFTVTSVTTPPAPSIGCAPCAVVDGQCDRAGISERSGSSKGSVWPETRPRPWPPWTASPISTPPLRCRSLHVSSVRRIQVVQPVVMIPTMNTPETSPPLGWSHLGGGGGLLAARWRPGSAW